MIHISYIRSMHAHPMHAHPMQNISISFNHQVTTCLEPIPMSKSNIPIARVNQPLYIYIYTYLHTVQDTYTRGRKKRLLCFFSPLLCVHHFCYYIAHESCVKNTFMLRCRESSGKKKPAVAGTISSMLRCIDSPLSTS